MQGSKDNIKIAAKQRGTSQKSVRAPFQQMTPNQHAGQQSRQKGKSSRSHRSSSPIKQSAKVPAEVNADLNWQPLNCASSFQF